MLCDKVIEIGERYDTCPVDLARSMAKIVREKKIEQIQRETHRPSAR